MWQIAVARVNYSGKWMDVEKCLLTEMYLPESPRVDHVTERAESLLKEVFGFAMLPVRIVITQFRIVAEFKDARIEWELDYGK